MLRVVLDTNIRYSSALFGGSPQEVDNRCQAPIALQLVSAPLLAELTKVLARRLPAPSVSAEIYRVQMRSLRVETSLRINICRDPDDNRVLECAVAGEADHIITGDKDLLVLHPFQNISILTVRQFLNLTFPPTKPLP